MWFVIMGTLMLLALACVGYLVACFHRFPALQKLGERRKLLSWLLAALPVLALGLFYFINVFTLMVVVLHLAAAFLLCALLSFLIRKITKKQIPYAWRGAAAILLAAVYLGIGWYNAHHVTETHYEIESAKPVSEELRIVLIADSHLGITLDGEDFAREMERVQALQPDLVVVVGDYVDDDTKRVDMERATRALGELQTSYGVYFVYGNHDEGYYQYRDFSAEDLRETLAKNGVIVLADESLPLGESYTLLGRRDRSMRDRADMETLTAELDDGRYQIVLDHQPNDYEAEAASGVDLVLSGHTHGGHMFPAWIVDRIMHYNDRRYGMETRDATTFIVTSGISGWAIPFKTGCFSEFAVIDIRNAG